MRGNEKGTPASCAAFHDLPPSSCAAAGGAGSTRSTRRGATRRGLALTGGSKESGTDATRNTKRSGGLLVGAGKAQEKPDMLDGDSSRDPKMVVALPGRELIVFIPVGGITKGQ